MQGEWDVLNECVVGRGRSVRLVELVTEIDGTYLTTYAADALILATPTGSTAYALAAGGPILPPELRNILIVPVAPHFSVDRAVVLHEGSTVSVTVRTDHQATLSMDGQTPVDLQDGDCVRVRAGDHTVQFVRLQDPGYFYRDLQQPHAPNPNPRSRLMTDAVLRCANHPDRETTLRCNRCEKPICTKCAVLTPVGYRCKECVRGQQAVFETAQTAWTSLWRPSLSAVGAGVGVAVLNILGFWGFFVAPVAGGALAEVVRLATRRRRGPAAAAGGGPGRRRRCPADAGARRGAT